VRGVKAVAEIDLARADVSTKRLTLDSRAAVERSLGVDEVAHLESEPPPGR
jgi:hypothetical protein